MFFTFLTTPVEWTYNPLFLPAPIAYDTRYSDNSTRPSFSLSDQIETAFNIFKSNNCKIIDENVVRNFLYIKNNIIDLSVNALPLIFREFGKNCPTSLEVVIDPEGNNQEGQLFLNIITDLSVDESLAKLNKIEKQYFSLSANLEFNINIAFV